jgi:hypothetical protein
MRDLLFRMVGLKPLGIVCDPFILSYGWRILWFPPHPGLCIGHPIVHDLFDVMDEAIHQPLDIHLDLRP